MPSISDLQRAEWKNNLSLNDVQAARLSHIDLERQNAKSELGLSDADLARLSLMDLRGQQSAGGGGSEPPPPVVLLLPGVASNFASTPDTVDNSITGDIDIRIRASALWASATIVLISKWGPSNTDKAYQILISGGNIYFDQSNLGTNTWQTSGGAHGLSDNEVAWIRATYRASDRRVQIFKSLSETDTDWVQIGANQQGVSSPMFNSTQSVRIGTNADGQFPLNGTVYEAKIYASVDETNLRVHFKPSDVQVAGVRDPNTYVAPTGETWTMNGTGWDWVAA